MLGITHRRNAGRLSPILDKYWHISDPLTLVSVSLILEQDKSEGVLCLFVNSSTDKIYNVNAKGERLSILAVCIFYK